MTVESGQQVTVVRHDFSEVFGMVGERDNFTIEIMTIFDGVKHIPWQAIREINLADPFSYVVIDDDDDDGDDDEDKLTPPDDEPPSIELQEPTQPKKLLDESKPVFSGYVEVDEDFPEPVTLKRVDL